MDPNTQRAEADRWLGIAAKLLTARDFLGSRTFAIRAREADPNNALSDQILAVVDTVLAGEKRVDTTQQPDWYSVLQLPRMVRDADVIATHFRRLSILLSPERNRLPFADYALQLIVEAWSVLSDPTKKWLFDNELALSLQRAAGATTEQQRVEPVRVDPIRFDPGGGGGDGGASASGGVSVGAGSHLNTFEFFQPQPAQQQQQQTVVPTLQMWQQQPPPPPPQLIQREFMPPPQPQPQPQPPPPPPPPQQQHVLPQWQMRDPTPNRSKGPINGIGAKVVASTPAPSTSFRAIPPPVAPTPMVAREKPTEVNRVVEDGNVVGVNTDCDSSNDVASNANANVNANVNASANADANAGGVDETNDDDVGGDGECFWTACPYCFYIYEYQKVYQDCTLRCQNCKRGFHATPVPNPPPIGPGKNPKESSFCCWGFFPIGFSMAALKKHNRSNGNWVPFSPMFACLDGSEGGNFPNSGNSVHLKNVRNRGGVGNAHASAPRVYIDDDGVFDDLSESSDADSSDRDWRNTGAYKKKRKHQKGGKRGRPRRVDRVNQGNQDSTDGGGGVSVAREDSEEGDGTQEVVVGLVAGKRTDVNKNVGPTVTRKQTRRSMKDMGRLDLNVEFNNEGDEHVPTVSAVHRDEDGIENIGFFEGLDEFLSTLPILNVGGDEKAKPS